MSPTRRPRTWDDASCSSRVCLKLVSWISERNRDTHVCILMRRLEMPSDWESNQAISLERRLAKMFSLILQACNSPKITQRARKAVLAIQFPIPIPRRTSAQSETRARASSPVKVPLPKPAIISKIFPRMTARTVLKPAEKAAAINADMSAPVCDRFVKAKSCFHDDLVFCSIANEVED